MAVERNNGSDAGIRTMEHSAPKGVLVTTTVLLLELAGLALATTARVLRIVRA